MARCKTTGCDGTAIALNPHYWACQKCGVVLKRGRMADRQGLVAKLLDHSYFEYATSPLQPSKVVVFKNNAFYTATRRSWHGHHGSYQCDYVMQLSGNNMFEYKIAPCCQQPLKVYSNRIQFCSSCGQAYGLKCECKSNLFLKFYRAHHRHISDSIEETGNALLECNKCKAIRVLASQGLIALSCERCPGPLVRTGNSDLWCPNCECLYPDAVGDRGLSSGTVSEQYALRCCWCRGIYKVAKPQDIIDADYNCEQLRCAKCGLSGAEAKAALNELKPMMKACLTIRGTIDRDIVGYSVRVEGLGKLHHHPFQDAPSKAAETMSRVTGDIESVLNEIRNCNAHPVAKQHAARVILNEAEHLSQYANTIGFKDERLESLYALYREAKKSPQVLFWETGRSFT